MGQKAAVHPPAFVPRDKIYSAKSLRRFQINKLFEMCKDLLHKRVGLANILLALTRSQLELQRALCASWDLSAMAMESPVKPRCFRR